MSEPLHDEVKTFGTTTSALMDANLKLGSVLSDVLGKSGQAILQALIKGESDPQKLADLAQGNARKKRAELVEALHGRSAITTVGC